MHDTAEADKEKERLAFEKAEKTVVPSATPGRSGEGTSSSAGPSSSRSSGKPSKESRLAHKNLPSYWVPNLTPKVSPETNYYADRTWQI